MDNITITIICSVISAVVAWYGAIGSMKKNTAEEASNMATLHTRFGFIQGSLEEIKLDLKESKEDRKVMSAHVETLETRVKALEKRVEKLEDKCRAFSGK